MYMPFGTARVNRSRTDFFVISASLIRRVIDCVIRESVSCKLFDHKQVSLYLGTKEEVEGAPNRLSNSFLDEKLLRYSVELATRRAHLYSLDCDCDAEAQRALFANELTCIRETIAIYKGLTYDMKQRARSGDVLQNELQIAAKQQEIQLRFDDMIPKGGQTTILVRWSAAQQTTEMLADQRTGKNSGQRVRHTF
jgi:hypothetical protein